MNSHSEGWLFSKYHSGYGVIFNYIKVKREMSFEGVAIFKYQSGFEVIFEISFGEYRILIRRSGYFLSINRVLRLFVKYNKVNRDLSFGVVVIF